MCCTLVPYRFSVPSTETYTYGILSLMSVDGWIYSGSTEFRETERQNKMTFPAIQTNHAKNKTYQRSESMFCKQSQC